MNNDYWIKITDDFLKKFSVIVIILIVMLLILIVDLNFRVKTLENKEKHDSGFVQEEIKTDSN